MTRISWGQPDKVDFYIGALLAAGLCLLSLLWLFRWRRVPVEIIPGKVSGAVLVKGSRVPVTSVLDSFANGVTAEGIAYDFDLSVQDVQAVLAYYDRACR